MNEKRPFMLDQTAKLLFISLKKEMESKLNRELTIEEQQFLKEMSKKNSQTMQ